MTMVRDLFLRAAEAHQAGRLDEAEAGYQAALAAEPDDPNALGNLGALNLQRGRLEQGLELIERSLQLRPDQPDAITNRATALAMLGRLGEALAVLQAAPSLGPSGVTLCVQIGAGLREAGDAERALAAYDTALRWRSGDPDILTDRAIALVDLQRLDEAITGFSSVLASSPRHARARFNLGVALHERHRFEEALQAFETARADGMDGAVVDGGSARTLRELGRMDEALAAFERSLAARPDWITHVEHGVALFNEHRIDEAAATLQAALEVSPGNPYAKSNLAVVRLAAGRMAEGWALYEDRWKASMTADYERLPRPLWTGETPIEGKTVLLMAEQGLGDTLQFVRYAPLVAGRGARVVLAVQPPLVELCGSLDGVAEVIADNAPPPAFDVCCPLMSLPFALRMDQIPDKTPYLRAPEDRVRSWAERLGPASKTRVGLVWSGGVRPGMPGYWAANTRRNIPLAMLAPLARTDAEFYSLQKGQPGEGEAGRLKAQGWDGPDVIDFAPELRDFADTAALAANLDLVISVCTSTAHMAGALGKPMWLLNHFDTCWRWGLERSDSPWYPTARVFRQTKRGAWGPVVEEVVEALDALERLRPPS